MGIIYTMGNTSINQQRTNSALVKGTFEYQWAQKSLAFFSIGPFILIYLAFAQVNGSAGSQIFQAYLQCRNKGTTTLHVLGGSVTNQPGYLACTRLQEVSQEFAALDSICLLFHRTRAPTQLMYMLVEIRRAELLIGCGLGMGGDGSRWLTTQNGWFKDTDDKFGWQKMVKGCPMIDPHPMHNQLPVRRTTNDVLLVPERTPASKLLKTRLDDFILDDSPVLRCWSATKRPNNDRKVWENWSFLVAILMMVCLFFSFWITTALQSLFSSLVLNMRCPHFIFGKRRASEFRTVESQSLFLRKVESQIQPLYAE